MYLIILLLSLLSVIQFDQMWQLLKTVALSRGLHLASVVNQFSVIDPFTWQPGFDLPCCSCSRINHFRTGLCLTKLFKWGLSTSDLCLCLFREQQTMHRIIYLCSSRGSERDLQLSPRCRKKAVHWLENGATTRKNYLHTPETWYQYSMYLSHHSTVKTHFTDYSIYQYKQDVFNKITQNTAYWISCLHILSSYTVYSTTNWPH